MNYQPKPTPWRREHAELPHRVSREILRLLQEGKLTGQAARELLGAGGGAPGVNGQSCAMHQDVNNPPATIPMVAQPQA